MAYGESVKTRAMALFLMGKNPEQIEKVLKPDFPKISANTIRKWAETPNAIGETWEDTKVQMEHVSRQKIKEEISSERTKLRIRNSTLLNAVYEKIVDESGKMIKDAKDPVQLGYLFKSLATFHLDLEDQDQDNISPIEVAHTLFDLLNQNPKVCRAMKEEWSKIKPKLLEWHSNLTGTKTIDGQVVETKRLSG